MFPKVVTPELERPPEKVAISPEKVTAPLNSLAPPSVTVCPLSETVSEKVVAPPEKVLVPLKAVVPRVTV